MTPGRLVPPIRSPCQTPCASGGFTSTLAMCSSGTSMWLASAKNLSAPRMWTMRLPPLISMSANSAALLANFANAVQQYRPGLDPRRPQHPVGGPGVLGEAGADGGLRLRLDDVKSVAAAFERPAEQDETGLDERIHEVGVFLPAVLRAHVARPVPGPAPFEPDDEDGHARTLALRVGEGLGRQALPFEGRVRAHRQPLLHHAAGARFEPGALPGGHELVDPRARKLDHELIARRQHGED